MDMEPQFYSISAEKEQKIIKWLIEHFCSFVFNLAIK